MNTKAISLTELQADIEAHLWQCCDTGQMLVVQMPDGRRVSLQPVEDEDDLINNLIEHNAKFRQLLAKSAAGKSTPFRPSTRKPVHKSGGNRRVGVAGRKK